MRRDDGHVRDDGALAPRCRGSGLKSVPFDFGFFRVFPCASVAKNKTAYNRIGMTTYWQRVVPGSCTRQLLLASLRINSTWPVRSAARASSR